MLCLTVLPEGADTGCETWGTFLTIAESRDEVTCQNMAGTARSQIR